LPVWEANKALGQLDFFKPTQTDRDDRQRTWNQLTGLFLIDRTGIVRWVFVEGTEGPPAWESIPPRTSSSPLRTQSSDESAETGHPLLTYAVRAVAEQAGSPEHQHDDQQTKP
jgi:hypothetical protein